MQWKVFIGCDMSKASFQYCIRTTEEILKRGEVSNDPRSIQAWLKDLQRNHNPDEILLGVEHTGIYTAILLRNAHALDVPIWLESARQIKLSLGLQRGKNDTVDSIRVAEYLMRFTDRAKLWKPKRKVLQQLALLQRSRDRLTKALNQLRTSLDESQNFLSKEEHQLLAASSTAAIQGIESSISQVDEKIHEMITNDEHLVHLQQLVTSVPGIGVVTFVELAIRTNEFKDFDNAKKLACTAGIAPFEHTSGSSIRGKTKVNHFAHKRLKTLLHMCAMSAIRSPGVLQQYYQRKVLDGKNRMSVINAVRNKLVHNVFAVVRNDVMYDKNYQYVFG